MRLKFTYVRQGGASTDLVAEFDAQATVGQFATHLASSDPKGAGVDGPVTLALAGPRTSLLDPSSLMAECGLGSGASISLAPASAGYKSGASEQNAIVRLEALTGPDRGRRFLLAAGSASIGRDKDCEVRLTDPLTSRRHARINVGDTIEIIDQASANGLMVGLAVTARAQLRTGDVVTVGDTELQVTQLQGYRRTSGTVEFIRPARVVREYAGAEFEAPAPPERRAPQRFPTIALIMPLIVGGLLFATTHRWASVIFVALSPLMLIGNAIESRIVGKREFRKAIEEFRSDLSGLADDVREELGREAVARLAENPSASDCLDAAMKRGDLLWSRRTDLPRFGEVRLGLGSRSTRSTISRPPNSRSPRELIRELDATLASLEQVDGVPIVADLGAGAVGLVGARVALMGAARSLVTQIVALHSPAELVLTAMLAPATVAEWDFLKWLPHTSSPQSPLTARPLAAAQDTAGTLLAELENLVAERSESEDSAAVRVVVLVESGAPAPHNRLVALAERGPAVGVYVVWVAPERGLLPAACKTFLDAELLANDGRVGYVVEGEEVVPVLVDTTSANEVADLAHSLAPVEDVAARIEDDSDLPRSISQLVTLGDTTLGSEPRSVIERWQSSSSILSGPYAPPVPVKKAGNLRAVVGMSAAGPHALDLRVDGPHALVGGSTNSGKSELLQGWILAMAATHSPERVTFLLVDYKGGSAFADCVNLPHTIDLITDLSPHMVRRALTSLSAELTYRERLLHQHDAKDLIEMEKHGIPGAPPSLIIVVDEFASLVNDVPEFVEGVVNVAARGRSLGLHLILATQQPSGVIKGSLRANTNLRIALRVTDEQDSVDVLNAPDAASFDPTIPGRAMSRSGPKRLVAFQASYAGGWTSDVPEPAPIKLEELDLVAPVAWEVPDDGPVAPKDREQTDIKRLVRAIIAANEAAALPAPRKAWLPILGDAVDLSTLPTRRRDDTLVFALGDDPETQSQPTVAFRPDREGSMAVYGTGGAGKSALLRSIAISAGFSQRGGPCQVYALDFGSQALKMLEPLPHVGSVVPGADHERVTRLLSGLRELIDERSVRYAAANAGTIEAYRSQTGHAEEPRILLLLDNMGAFRQAYETTDRQRYVDMLTSIAGDGRPVGVHVVVSATERIAIPTTLSSAIQRRIVMRMAQEDDYAMLGVPGDILDSHSSAGRAIDGDLEIQVGILGTDRDDASQAQRIKDLAAALTAAGVAPAPPIRSLPSQVALADIAGRPGEVVVGLDSASLAPVGLVPQATFLVTGPPGSGRTTALRTIVAGVRRTMPSAELHYFGQRRSVLAAGSWTSSATSIDEVAAGAQELATRIQQTSPRPGSVVVVVEDIAEFAMTPADAALQALVKACTATDQWVVAEGEVSTLRGSAGFLGLIRSSRRGLALQPDQETGATLFSTSFPRVNRAEFPVGRGFLVGSGRAGIIQVAEPGAGG